MKTVWNITTSLTGKKIKNEITNQLNTDGNITYGSETYLRNLSQLLTINS
jgi:hypothetical protein